MKFLYGSLKYSYWNYVCLSLLFPYLYFNGIGWNNYFKYDYSLQEPNRIAFYRYFPTLMKYKITQESPTSHWSKQENLHKFSVENNEIMYESKCF